MNKTTTPTLKIGTTVKWTSGAGGFNKTKTGKVVGVVLKGKTPHKKFPTVRTGGGVRNATSFVVDVKGKFYWPHASLLKAV